MLDKSSSRHRNSNVWTARLLFPFLTYVSPFAELHCANDANFHSLISIHRRINRSRYLYACEKGETWKIG